VKIDRSPGFAVSTMSPLKIISMERGMDPAGISEETSWTLTFYQSIKMLCDIWRSQFTRFWQFWLVHLIGVVNLYCCSTGPTSALQMWHKKTPINSSGLTSVVRVTVP
jgi:hypothetical protein